MPKRSNLFQDVVAIIHRHMAGEATVEESAMLTDRRTGRKREVDVTVTQTVGGHEVIVSVEATARGRKADQKWVDSMIGMHEDLPTSELVLVSEAGFTRGARERAEAKGVTAISPEDWSGDDPGFKVVARLKSVWPKVVAMTPQRYSVQLRLPDGREEWFHVEPDLTLFADTGRPLGLLYPMVKEIIDVNWLDMMRQLGLEDIDESEERSFDLTLHGPWTVRVEGETEPRQICARWEETEPPELHSFVAVRVEGHMKIDVAEVPLEHRRLGSTAVAYGVSQLGDTPALLVVTEDASGGKATLRLKDRGDVPLDGTGELRLTRGEPGA